jgi:glycogen(starch) synthase
MRTLMLSWEYPPKNVGGLARHVYDLSKELADQGEEIFLITCAGDGAPAEEISNQIHIFRVENLNLTSRDFITWVLQLNFAFLEKAMIIEEKYGPFDLIHAHDWLVSFVACAMKRAKNIPLLATIHATEYGRNHGIHNDLQRYISDVEWWLTYESRQVIVCSQYMREELKNIFQLPEDKIQMVPNGVNINSFQSFSDAFDRKQYAQKDEQIVFFVGRLVQEKGIQVLLQAVPKILHYCPEAKFIIAGTGPYEEYLKQKAHMLNKSKKIIFTGYINDDIRNGLYKNAHVAVFPSLYEPFGIVTLEAMAAGASVVVTDTGGFNEVVTHGIDGLKAYSGDPDSLADNIILMLKNRYAAQIMKKNAFNKVVNYFTWPQIAAQTIKIYQMIQEEAGKVKIRNQRQMEERFLHS